jgi:hypothetical protein
VGPGDEVTSAMASVSSLQCRTTLSLTVPYCECNACAYSQALSLCAPCDVVLTTRVTASESASDCARVSPLSVMCDCTSEVFSMSETEIVETQQMNKMKWVRIVSHSGHGARNAGMTSLPA